MRRRGTETDYLFTEGDLRATLENVEAKLRAEVEQYEPNRLLNTPVDDLCSFFAQKFRVEPLSLQDQDTTTDQQETKVDVSRDRDYNFYHGSDGPHMVPATEVAFFVPFTGDPMLFKLAPNTTTSNPPHGEVRGNDLIFSLTQRTPDHATIRREFDAWLNNVKQYVSWGTGNVEAFNAGLVGVARASIEARRKRLLEASNMQASLGFPMRRRDGVPTTFAAPAVKRKLPPSPPAASSAPFRPEPALAMEEYEHILSVVDSMTHVMERSPATFKTLGEEAIRDHFLIQLNGHYEGAATGETFNGEGKTDILVRQDGKNIFIAECKFWDGPSMFAKTIDQLLSYTTWRDTKTALFIFVRDTALSTVLEKIPQGLRAHSAFKRDMPIQGETRFRSVFGQPKDPSREFFVTTLVFNMPR